MRRNLEIMSREYKALPNSAVADNRDAIGGNQSPRIYACVSTAALLVVHGQMLIPRTGHLDRGQDESILCRITRQGINPL
jgi:hypothetical protein